MVCKLKEPEVSISARLREKSANVISRIEAHEAYALLLDPPMPFGRDGVCVLLRNLLLRTHYYGNHLTEAVFTAIGRFPKTKPQLMRPLVEQVLDEVYHPEMAAKDFVRLGGDSSVLAESIRSPASFVVAAVCRVIAERADPFAYLGFLALLESTTPILTERMMPVLSQLGMVADSRFVPLHAKEDHAHASLIWEQIDKVSQQFSDAAIAIEFGFDCFALVYPTLVWDEALAQTQAELAAAPHSSLKGLRPIAI
jgi:hypothetical protein